MHAPTNTDSAKEIIERYVRAVELGDAAAIRGMFTEDAVWQLDGELPISGTWRGRDVIMNEFLATAMSYYQPGSVGLEVTSMTAEDDRVVMEWTSRARTARGEPYENHCIGVFTMRDGRIEGVREYMDTLYAHRVAFAAGDGVTAGGAVAS
jgi:uncharacterized protein (TIGR02246 family)